MDGRKKTFDCVEMKSRIQSDLKQEYETRKSEFSSYIDFLKTTANESEEIRTFIKKVADAKNAAKS